jgi:hypothetical protein
MPSSRGVLRRDKGKRDLVLTGDRLDETLQEIQSIQIPEIDPLETQVAKYKKLQDALSLLDQKLAKLDFYKESFDAKRSDAASQASLRQFNAIVRNTETRRNSYQKQKESLESLVQKAEQKRGLTSIQDYKKQQEAEKESVKALQDEAKALYKQRGALCDSEGFYQHYGECWSDSIQQLFLNADGIKEVTQKHLILYPEVNTQTLPDVLFLAVVNPLGLSRTTKGALETVAKETRDFIWLQKQWVSLYFHEVKKRFLRHYLTEGKRREFYETCSLDEPIATVAKRELAQLSKQARQHGNEAIRTAIFGKFGILNSSKEKYTQFEGLASASPELYAKPNSFTQGGTFFEILILLNIFNHTFFSDTLEYRVVEQEKGEFVNAGPGEARVKLRTPEDLLLSTARGILASATYTDSSGKEVFRHLISFYTCGGQDFLFDNETGILPFHYRKFLSHYFETRDQKPSLTFCRYVKDDSSQRYSTEMYPILEFPTSPPSYTTVLGDMAVEFSSFPFTQGSVQLVQGHTATMNYLMIVSQPTAPLLENTGYQFQSEARLGRLKQANLNAFGRAVSQATNEQEAFDQLSVLRSPPLDMTVLAPKTAIPYPLVYLAVRLNWMRFLVLLLEKGYDPNSKLTEGPRRGMTALMLACTSGNYEAARILLEAKADTNLSDRNGFRAIHIAVLQTNLALLQLLVNAGANVNAQTNTGATPLYYAASIGNLDTIEYLCSKGADGSLKGAEVSNEALKRPVEIAKNFQVKAVLMRCGKTGGTRRNRKAKRSTRRLKL